MELFKSIDVEDELRQVLTRNGFNAFCPPLPAEYALPNILVSQSGGSASDDWKGTEIVDRFTVSLQSRAGTEEEALSVLRTAIAVLKAKKSKKIASISINSLFSWGTDTTRPDLAMCGATLIVTARTEKTIL